MGYNQGGRERLRLPEFESWLDEMATEPLPGGVAAAATAAAMGAALAAKVAGIGQLQPSLHPDAQRTSPSLVDLAQASREELVGLAAADEEAYRRVLDTRHLADDEAKRRAWEQATALPLSLTEACRQLLSALPRLEEVGSPDVAVDLEIGRRLLEVGVAAGLLAARENLSAWGADWDSTPYARRLAVLIEEEEI